MVKPLFIPVLWLMFCHGGWCCWHLVANNVGRCYCHSSWCYCYIFLWLMLLPQWLMLLWLGTFVLADVIAMVANVITTQGVCRVVWQMLKPIVVDVITTSQQFILGLVLRCWPEPHPKCVADGICQCSYLGMDYLPLCTRLLLWFSKGYDLLSPRW